MRGKLVDDRYEEWICKVRVIDGVVGQKTMESKLIRCNDCKFFKTYYHGAESKLGMFTYECLIRGLYTVTAVDFCSKAERK